MSTPTSASVAHKVPQWAVNNKKIFLAGCGESRENIPIRKEREELAKFFADKLESVAGAARSHQIYGNVSMATQYGATRGILPPDGPASAAYFRDVANHAEVLSTIIHTARTTVDFLPRLTGNHLTHQESQEYLKKFNEFIHELDLYHGYVTLLAANTSTIQNNSIDCSAMVNAIVGVVATTLKVATGGATYNDLVKDVSALISSAIGFVTEEGASTSANFEMVPLGASHSGANPISGVNFTITRLSRRQDGKSTLEESFLTIAAYSYQLNSNRIIDDANRLAGATITTSHQLVEEINAPLMHARRSHSLHK